jgi:hypothetical protein
MTVQISLVSVCFHVCSIHQTLPVCGFVHRGCAYEYLWHNYRGFGPHSFAVYLLSITQETASAHVCHSPAIQILCDMLYALTVLITVFRTLLSCFNYFWNG